MSSAIGFTFALKYVELAEVHLVLRERGWVPEMLNTHSSMMWVWHKGEERIATEVINFGSILVWRDMLGSSPLCFVQDTLQHTRARHGRRWQLASSREEITQWMEL